MIWKKFIDRISEAETDDTIIQIEKRFACDLIDAHEIQYKILLETEAMLRGKRKECDDLICQLEDKCLKLQKIQKKLDS